MHLFNTHMMAAFKFGTIRMAVAAFVNQNRNNIYTNTYLHIVYADQILIRCCRLEIGYQTKMFFLQFLYCKSLRLYRICYPYITILQWKQRQFVNNIDT